MPKHLLPVLGRRSLLQATVARLRGLVPATQVLVVTHGDHVAEVRRQLPGVPQGNVLAEPVGRNTAPCLALAALEIARRAPGATFVSLPADHAISAPRAFRATLAEAFGWAARDPVAVTIGVQPTAPETGYGYLRLGRPLGANARRVVAFVEKPPRARARRFVRSGRYLWNSGIFAWRVTTALDLLDRHLPEVTGPLRTAVGTPRRRRAAALARCYRSLPSVSIDYGVMEQARDVVVVRGAFGWSDVGSWAALAVLRGARPDGTPVVPIESSGYVVFGAGRVVALVGVQDVIVVDTPDALLICDRRRAQDVRRVVEELDRRGLEAYL